MTPPWSVKQLNRQRRSTLQLRSSQSALSEICMTEVEEENPRHQSTIPPVYHRWITGGSLASRSRGTLSTDSLSMLWRHTRRTEGPSTTWSARSRLLIWCSHSRSWRKVTSSTVASSSILPNLISWTPLRFSSSPWVKMSVACLLFPKLRKDTVGRNRSKSLKL